MSRVDVECKSTIYEIDGEDPEGLDLPQLVVRSHWNWQDCVVIEVGGKQYTVVASDLEAAIRNARNSG